MSSSRWTSKSIFLFAKMRKVIDDVRNRVAAYEDSIRHHHEMVEMATYKISKIINPEFSTTASFSVFGISIIDSSLATLAEIGLIVTLTSYCSGSSFTFGYWLRL